MWDKKPTRFPWIAGGMALGLTLFHLVVNRQYGFHGDELYFLVCGNRPAFGYVDHPPLVPLVARFAVDLLGLDLFSLRLFPALALGLGCFLTGWLARRLGAGRFGAFLASLSFVATPMMIRVGAFLNIPCIEVVFWLVVAHLVVTIVKRDDPRLWLWVGVVCGVALLNKHTTLFLGTGLLAGMFMTERRRDLATPWPWLGGIAAFLIFLPNLVWQYQNDWATLAFVRRINETAMGSPLEFVLGQVILMNLANGVVFFAGLIYFFRAPEARHYRMLGWVFVVVLVIMLLLRAKVYYLLPAYPLLMAGGAVYLERRFATGRARFVRPAIAAAVAGVGLVFVPIMAPVGTLAWKEAYISRVLGFVLDDPRDLTFDFHYQLGRYEEVEAIRDVYWTLSPEAQEVAVILTDEYDTASAVNILSEPSDILGFPEPMSRAPDLPRAISGNNTYYLWGPGDATGECVIALGYDEAFLKTCFGEVHVAGEAPDRMGDGLGKPIYVCRKPVAPLEELWPRFKAYY